MKRFAFSLAALALSISGCISATATEPLTCKSSTLTFTTGLPNVNTGAGGGYTLPPVSASTQVDLSGIVTKVSGAGEVHVQIVKNLLTSNAGTFDWVQHISVALSGVQNPIDYPSRVLVDQDVKTSGTEVSLVPILDGDTVFRYLSQGAVQLTFTITGSAPSNTSGIDMTNEFCTSDTLTVSKSL